MDGFAKHCQVSATRGQTLAQEMSFQHAYSLLNICVRHVLRIQQANKISRLGEYYSFVCHRSFVCHSDFSLQLISGNAANPTLKITSLKLSVGLPSASWDFYTVFRFVRISCLLYFSERFLEWSGQLNTCIRVRVDWNFSRLRSKSWVEACIFDSYA